MSYNIRHLKYFIATAELGQVSRAAVELSVSQSAVTAAVRELEAILGTKLFIRSAQGMSLTDAGRRFLASGYEIVAKVEDSLRAADTIELQGDLTVAATYTVLGYFLPGHIERLGRVMPDVTLKVSEMSRQALEAALLDNQIEIAVALTSNISHPELAKETLLSSPRRLWLSSRHPMADRKDLDLADVAKEPYVMLTVDEAAHTAMRYWAPSAATPNVVLRTSSVEAVRSMVANGQGVSILSDMVYRPWSLEGRRIEVANLSAEIPPMDVGLVWRKDAQFTPIMIAFRDYFRGLFGTPQSALGALRVS